MRGIGTPKASEAIRAASLLLALFGSMAIFYVGATTWRQRHPGRAERIAAEASEAQAASKRFPTGRYLLAYVFVSSQCGFCTEKGTERAIAEMRDSLRAHQLGSFADVTVIGVSLDQDVEAGTTYLESLGRLGATFDQTSVGGSWLNEFAAQMIWRRALARPATPQVVLMVRHVDAEQFPRNIEVQADSLLLNITGRDSLITWVNSGTPVDQRTS